MAMQDSQPEQNSVRAVRPAGAVESAVRTPGPRGVPLFWALLLVALGPALLSGALFFALARHGADVASVALACTVVAAAAAAGARHQQGRLRQALRNIANRADFTTVRYSGEVPTPGRTELVAVARSVDAMTAALENTLERTRESLEAETQNGLDLQRQYALMQLLRNLASVANEGEPLERALQDSLEEIGDYLDWPIGRLVLVTHGKSPRTESTQSHWYAPEADRFAAFTEACSHDPAAVAQAGLIGRAIESSLSHWITDLGQLAEWPPCAAAKACGLRTGFVIPIAAAPEVTALIEFYSVHRIEASAEMLELVEAISVELWRTASRCAAAAHKPVPGALDRRLASVAERMEQAILLAGADGRVEWANAGLLNMLGATLDQCVGKEVPNLLFSGDPTSAAQCRQHVQADEPVQGLILSCRAEGRPERCFELEIQPLAAHGAAAGHKYAGGFVLVRDITRARATQDALNDALEAARQASQSKSQFLANMSHEIRTPMNGVLGMAELLLGTSLDERQRRFIESLYRSGEALLEILNDILDFSKIEAGKLEIQAVDFDLRALIDDLIELLAVRAHAKKIELAYRLSPGVPPIVHGDPTRLRQVLINVVGNAIKFTEYGEVVLSVEVLAEDAVPAAGPAVTRLQFEVRDTGIGMRPDEVERLFTVFMQADPSSSRRYGGTGLGLAISRQLTELMKGSIGARSRIGQGSTFRIELPMEHGVTPALPRGPAGLAALANKRVLIVEDNPTNRRILEEQLQLSGMDCASAENGRQALQILCQAAQSKRPFDLAVIDMKMPIMDGLTLVESLRAVAELRELRLVMLTSMSDRDDARRAQNMGVDAYLCKPVRQQELLACLNDVLQACTTQGAPVPAPEALLRLGLQGQRILVVEDNPVNQEVVRAMLDEFGCCSTLAGDGLAALRLLERQLFDVVLMDCQMPLLDGFETLRRMRTPNDQRLVGPRLHDGARSTPVIALTANALAGDAERCRAAGFCDYLAKPFRQSDLAQILLRWCGPGAPTSVPDLVPAGRAVTAPTAVALPIQQVALAAEPARAGAPQPSADALPVLDAAVLGQIQAMERNGANDLLQRLVEVYEQSSSSLIEAGERALAQADAAGLAQALHTLKSSSASLGALRFARACAEIGAHTSRLFLVDAQARWAELRVEHEKALAALRQFAPAAVTDRAQA